MKIHSKLQKEQIDWLRRKLEKAEQSGFSKHSKEEIRSLAKQKSKV